MRWSPVEEACVRACVRVLTGMRQKSATQFGGVPRLSRLVVGPEAMALSYYSVWSYKIYGVLVCLEDGGLFLEILRFAPRPSPRI